MGWSGTSKAYLSGLWVAVIIFLYLTLLTDDNVNPSPSSASISMQSLEQRWKITAASSNVIDAVVYIAMGSAASGRLVEYSVGSLRNVDALVAGPNTTNLWGQAVKDPSQ